MNSACISNLNFYLSCKSVSLIELELVQILQLRTTYMVQDQFYRQKKGRVYGQTIIGKVMNDHKNLLITSEDYKK